MKSSRFRCRKTWVLGELTSVLCLTKFWDGCGFNDFLNGRLKSKRAKSEKQMYSICIYKYSYLHIYIYIHYRRLSIAAFAAFGLLRAGASAVCEHLLAFAAPPLMPGTLAKPSVRFPATSFMLREKSSCFAFHTVSLKTSSGWIDFTSIKCGHMWSIHVHTHLKMGTEEAIRASPQIFIDPMTAADLGSKTQKNTLKSRAPVESFHSILVAWPTTLLFHALFKHRHKTKGRKWSR